MYSFVLWPVVLLCWGRRCCTGYEPQLNFGGVLSVIKRSPGDITLPRHWLPSCNSTPRHVLFLTRLAERQIYWQAHRLAVRQIFRQTQWLTDRDTLTEWEITRQRFTDRHIDWLTDTDWETALLTDLLWIFTTETIYFVITKSVKYHKKTQVPNSRHVYRFKCEWCVTLIKTHNDG